MSHSWYVAASSCLGTSLRPACGLEEGLSSVALLC